ncbi:hypothetical protein [Streptomyces marianii]|uniref:Uncharacterized protein n=1 Tax=Streptomyces marianii TaxID=1817406 RepID=A0A5R9DZZ6_9ACTN|nr:hypothetical protein [Streptomyces marianii]TLQ42355.1 hypothetical protein FEF34_03230 [Streptomyces marianii]
MTTFVVQGGTEDSPDLLDTAVWALGDLFLDPTMPPPRGEDDQRLSGAGNTGATRCARSDSERNSDVQRHDCRQ